MNKKTKQKSKSITMQYKKSNKNGLPTETQIHLSKTNRKIISQSSMKLGAKPTN
jgi:hypothetical protein